MATRQIVRISLPIAAAIRQWGNVGGLMARAAGLPVLIFIASTSINDVLPRFMETGEYKPADSIPTFGNDPEEFKAFIEEVNF